MSIERHLHRTADAVSRLWTDESNTRDRLAALRDRATNEAADQEAPSIPSRVGHRDLGGTRSEMEERGPGPLSDTRLLTVAEVAKLMRVSKMTVYRLVHEGQLAAFRFGRTFRVSEEAVAEYLAAAFDGANVDGL